jgi:sugar phosphate isomerase/epimerase
VLEYNRRNFFQKGFKVSLGVFAIESLYPMNLIGDDSEKRQKINISIQSYSYGSSLLNGEMNILDFPKIVREKFGLDGAEYWNIPLLKKRKNKKFLGEIRKRTQDYGINNTLMLVDFFSSEKGMPPISLCSTSAKERNNAIEAHKEWLDIASEIGCSGIRVNLRSQKMSSSEVAKLSQESLTKLLEYSSKQGLSIVIENHGGYTSDAKWVVALMKKINNKFLGTLPDFGTSNFCVRRKPIQNEDYFSSECVDQYNKYQGVEELLPYAKGISAKSRQFDKLGEETETDYNKMMSLIKKSDFEGYMAIEYEGSMMEMYGYGGNFLSSNEGILATKSLIEKYL